MISPILAASTKIFSSYFSSSAVISTEGIPLDQIGRWLKKLRQDLLGDRPSASTIRCRMIAGGTFLSLFAPTGLLSRKSSLAMFQRSWRKRMTSLAGDVDILRGTLFRGVRIRHRRFIGCWLWRKGSGRQRQISIDDGSGSSANCATKVSDRTRCGSNPQRSGTSWNFCERFPSPQKP